MNNCLSFIIPSFKETEKNIFPLLSSIASQVGLQQYTLEAIIVRDGTEALNLDLFNMLDLDIKQILMETNLGPGVARQRGLEAATGKYVMFCDADDILHSVGIIGAMVQEMDSQEWDILKTPWLEEYMDNETKQLLYFTHEVENTWMHGKMFRRDFLMKNNIAFRPDLRVHEDTYFNSIALEYTEKVGYLNVTSYIWKWGENSITRHDNGIYRYDSALEFIRACTLAHERIEIINPTHMDYKIIQLVLYHYFMLHSNNWQAEEFSQYRIDTEQAIAAAIKPFWKYWTNAEPELIIKIYNEERSKNFVGQIETETLDTWLQRLGLYK